MARFLLDTCVVSDFVKGDATTLAHIKSCRPSDIAISALTVFEVQYGLELKPAKKAIIHPVISAFFQQSSILNFTVFESANAASLRANLKLRGQPIGAYDLLIAATAIAHNLTLITSNTNEFQRMEGLQLLNWRTI